MFWKETYGRVQNVAVCHMKSGCFMLSLLLSCGLYLMFVGYILWLLAIKLFGEIVTFVFYKPYF